MDGALPASEVDWQLRIDFAQHAGSAILGWRRTGGASSGRPSGGLEVRNGWCGRPDWSYVEIVAGWRTPPRRMPGPRSEAVKQASGAKGAGASRLTARRREGCWTPPPERRMRSAVHPRPRRVAPRRRRGFERGHRARARLSALARPGHGRLGRRVLGARTEQQRSSSEGAGYDEEADHQEPSDRLARGGHRLPRIRERRRAQRGLRACVGQKPPRRVSFPPDDAEVHHAYFLLCRARGMLPPSFDEMRVELRRRVAA